MATTSSSVAKVTTFWKAAPARMLSMAVRATTSSFKTKPSLVGARGGRLGLSPSRAYDLTRLPQTLQRANSSRDARTKTYMRKLRHSASARFDGSDDLLFRVHLLPFLCRKGSGQRLSELRRRFLSATDSTKEQLEGRQLSWRVSCRQSRKASSGGFGRSRTVRQNFQINPAGTAII